MLYPHPRARRALLMVAFLVPVLAACAAGGSDNPTIVPPGNAASHSGAPSTSLAATTTVTAGPTTTAPPPGGTVAGGTTTTTSRSAAVATTTPTPSATTTTTARTPATGSVRLTESSNNQTVTVAKGATVTVVLSNTYWMMAPASPASVLAQQGDTVTAPTPMGQCVPGAGCGTVTTTYAAVGAGNAVISASRTTCGEALACTGGAGSYDVEVIVTG